VAWGGPLSLVVMQPHRTPRNAATGVIYNMPGEHDFERAWLAKFSRCLDEVVGEDIRKEVMRGSEGLSSHSSPREVIHWSKGAMERLESLTQLFSETS
jgi:hypothetical protein